MKSSQFFNIGIRPFAMIASAKQQLSPLAFLAITLLCPSLRSDIVYDVGVNSNGNYLASTLYSGDWGSEAYYNGNTFSTSTRGMNLSSISLYLTNYSSATGNANLKIYNTNFEDYGGGYSGYRATGSSIAQAVIDRTSIAAGPTPPGSANLYTFNFTGSNAINIAADTRYAFILETTGLGVWINSSNSTSQNVVYKNEYDYGEYGAGTSYGFFGSTNSMAGKVEIASAETTAVPEPGTLILTGSALLAGAIGVYFTRRHKDQALTPAAV